MLSKSTLSDLLFGCNFAEMASYAPLFVNANDRRWNPDAIVYNSLPAINIVNLKISIDGMKRNTFQSLGSTKTLLTSSNLMDENSNKNQRNSGSHELISTANLQFENSTSGSYMLFSTSRCLGLLEEILDSFEFAKGAPDSAWGSG
ncbi:hypothetical protein RHGRI_029469 [Rhododendron griersonianum]|uniref:Uncharacterized protein n=1 Tax=Rhododendron griersonianum TaxID=479676 RepID=A0AAV6IK33_9ERIC|nr:hypothetical protein RHGRI_029469 [Rhododendron griersonianum]